MDDTKAYEDWHERLCKGVKRRAALATIGALKRDVGREGRHQLAVWLSGIRRDTRVA